MRAGHIQIMLDSSVRGVHIYAFITSCANAGACAGNGNMIGMASSKAIPSTCNRKRSRFLYFVAIECSYRIQYANAKRRKGTRVLLTTCYVTDVFAKCTRAGSRAHFVSATCQPNTQAQTHADTRDAVCRSSRSEHTSETGRQHDFPIRCWYFVSPQSAFGGHHFVRTSFAN